MDHKCNNKHIHNTFMKKGKLVKLSKGKLFGMTSFDI